MIRKPTAKAPNDHWTEHGRATAVANSNVTDRPRRSVPALGPHMSAQPMLKFVKVFCRDLQGKHENAVFLNADHIVKIELAACGAEEVSSIITLINGEKLEVAGTPEDLVTHERYIYPKTKAESRKENWRPN